MFDLLVLGNGPAGISAAIYAARSGLSVQVVGRDSGALQKADKIENFYGFTQPISGPELVRSGVEQARRLGVTVTQDEALGATYDGAYTLRGQQAQYQGGALVLATGSQRRAPHITGLQALEGKGVSYCAVCDAFFYRQLPVAVLGEGSFALHEALELQAVAGAVTILTHGKQPEFAPPQDIAVDTRKIAALQGEDTLHSIRFEDGDSLMVRGLFIAQGVAGSGALARMLGAQTQGTAIVVDAQMATGIPGLFAAGDCTGGVYQIAKAVYEGMRAGVAAAQFVRQARAEQGQPK